MGLWGEIRLMTKKILVVDDELHLVHIVCYKLKKMGYDVVTAHNGRDGYQLACQHKPDAIVTDYQMPVMDGFEMAVQLRANPDTTAIPLIMLTARGHKIPPSQLTQTNIRNMMAKPFSAIQLIENLTELLLSSDPQSNDDDPNREGHAA